MTEPISDEDLAKFREVHQRTGDPEMGPDRCIEGRWVTWPCASVAVLARLDAAESRARDAEGERPTTGSGATRTRSTSWRRTPKPPSPLYGFK